jgi:hypothetical protein
MQRDKHSINLNIKNLVDDEEADGAEVSVDVRLAGDHVNGLAGDDVGDVRLAGEMML